MQRLKAYSALRRRLVFFAACLGCCAALSNMAGCGADKSSPVDTALKGRGSGEAAENIPVAIRLSKIAVNVLESAEVVVTAADMDTLTYPLDIEGDFIRGTIPSVPAGEQRKFTLNGFGAGNILLYTGSTTVNFLLPGESISLSITMYRIDKLERREIKVPIGNGANMDFVWIEPGTFRMGSLSTELGRDEDEGPAHTVTLTKGFWIGKYEVTQRQYELVTGLAPWLESDSNSDVLWGSTTSTQIFSFWQSTDRGINPNFPVGNVTKPDIRDFLAKVNATLGDSLVRLPTEAEWEYVARAGTTNRFFFGDDDNLMSEYACLIDTTKDDFGNIVYSGKWPCEVGQFKPNPWGVYDIYGNMTEIVYEQYGSSAPVSYTARDKVDPLRRVNWGGTFSYIGYRGFGGPLINDGYYPYMRSAYRGYGHYRVSDKYHTRGFRLLLMREP